MSFDISRIFVFVLAALICSVLQIVKGRSPVFVPAAAIVCLLALQFAFFHAAFTPFFRECLISAVLCALILWIAKILSGGAVGLSEMIFASLCGFFTGWILFSMIALGISIVTAVIYYVIFSFTRMKKTNGAVVFHHQFNLPYVIFMSAGTLLTYWLLWINWLNF